jgi:hypothetical protein
MEMDDCRRLAILLKTSSILHMAASRKGLLSLLGRSRLLILNGLAVRSDRRFRLSSMSLLLIRLRFGKK